MAKITDPSKLLPSSKSSSAIVKVGKTSITSSFRESRKIISASSIRKSESKGVSDVNGALVKIEKLFQSELISSRKKAEEKRKEQEKQDFDKAEKKLELPKLTGFKLPKIPLTITNFFDRVKRFLFFTALGWLIPTLIEMMPKLQGIVSVIGNVYQFAEGLFGKLFDGFMSFVKFGGDLTKQTLGFIASAKTGPGGNYQKEFDKLEKQFNLFVDSSIVAGLLGLDIAISAIPKPRKPKIEKPTGPREPSRERASVKGAARVTEGRGGQRGLGKGPEIAEKVTEGGKSSSLWKRLTGGLKSKFSGVIGKLAKPFGKFVSVAVPGFGAAAGFIDAKARAKSGDKIGSFLAGLSASLDAFTASVAIAGLASAATGVGLPAAAVLETVAAAAGSISIAIDVILLIRDLLSLIPGIPKSFLGFSRGGRVVRGYQGGGTTKPTGTPRRTYTPAKRKPFKIAPQKSQPGKDVGGKSEINILYPDSKKKLTVNEWMKGNYAGTYLDYEKDYKERANKPNPYKALTSSAEKFKELPLGLGHIIGAAIDSSLGQKVDVKRAVQQFSSGISYLFESYSNQRVNMSLSSLSKDINSFVDGGYVPPSRQMRNLRDTMNFGDMISRVIEPVINLKINEVIQIVKKEIGKKGVKRERGGDITDQSQPTGEDLYDYTITGGELPSKYPGRGPTTGHNYPAKDYQVEVGRAISVFVPGTVVRAGIYDPNGYGNEIIIKHDNGLFSQYAHLSKIMVNEGDRIENGKVIGLSGGQPGARGAGRTTGPHLHFEVRDVNGNKITRERSGDSYFRFGTVTRVQRTERSPDNLPRTGNFITGKASWYGPGFNGGPTASGETYDQNKLTAAMFRPGWNGSRPFNVEVTNLANNKKVRVRVNDTGPFAMDSSGRALSPLQPHPTRIIDLSKAAMTALGGTGIIDVRVEKLGAASSQQPPRQDQQRPPESLSTTSVIEAQNKVKNMRLRAGERLNFPGVGYVVYKKNEKGTLFKVFYDLNGNEIQPTEFFKRIKDGESQRQRPPQAPRLPQRPQQSAQSNNRRIPLSIINKLKPMGEIPFTVNGIPYVFKVNFQNGLNVFESFPYLNRVANVTKPIDIRGNQNKEIWDAIKEKINAMKLQSGGFIAPSKSRLPIPNKFASYENYGQGMLLAIQPIQTIIEKPSASSNSVITFPVLIGVNNNTNSLDSYRG